MTDYSKFLNQEIINTSNESGVVLSFDDSHIVVRYPDGEKTYNSDIAFKSKFLSFKNEELNALIQGDIKEKDNKKAEQAKEVEKAQRINLKRRERINEVYKQLAQKEKVLKRMFGSDFIYPPLKAFEKKYKPFIYVEDPIAKIFNSINPRHSYYQWYDWNDFFY